MKKANEELRNLKKLLKGYNVDVFVLGKNYTEPEYYESDNLKLITTTDNGIRIVFSKQSDINNTESELNIQGNLISITSSFTQYTVSFLLELNNGAEVELVGYIVKRFQD